MRDLGSRGRPSGFKSPCPHQQKAAVRLLFLHRPPKKYNNGVPTSMENCEGGRESPTVNLCRIRKHFLILRFSMSKFCRYAGGRRGFPAAVSAPAPFPRLRPQTAAVSKFFCKSRKNLLTIPLRHTLRWGRGDENAHRWKRRGSGRRKPGPMRRSSARARPRRSAGGRRRPWPAARRKRRRPSPCPRRTAAAITGIGNGRRRSPVPSPVHWRLGSPCRSASSGSCPWRC